MEHIHKTALVPYPVAAMYQLVNDIEHYPDFLPWCGGTEVLQQDEKNIVARVDINKAAFRQSFTTKNTLKKDQEIYMELQEGPFKTLSGKWLFFPLQKGMVNGCKVELILDWEFANKITSKLLGGVFAPIADKMMDSFINRAHALFKES